MDTLLLTKIIESVVVIVVASIILYIIKQYLIKKVAYTSKDSQHIKTLIGVIFNVAQYIVVLMAIIIVLRINGFNVTSLLAGLGIVATIVGLALQDTLKDIISGIAIYTNNFYKVGDVVTYQGALCEVKYFSARVTKFQNVYTGSTFTVYNSQISSIEKVKETKVINLSFHIWEDADKIADVLKKAAEELEKDELFHDIYTGIYAIGENGLEYYVALHTDRKDYYYAGRAVPILYKHLKAAGIMPMSKADVRLVQEGKTAEKKIKVEKKVK